LIEAYTEPGELVVDFFCSGGTTLVAAKQSGRRWLGFDISEESVALSKRRLYGEN
jgi:site-specific DNA-methyltransferase (adenine-specific)